MYGDVELLLIGWLKGVFPTARVVTERPATLTPPLIFVKRIGGADATPGVDTARVDVDCFGVDYTAGSLLARQVWSALRFQLPSYTSSGGTVLRVDTGSAPNWIPYDDVNVRCFAASYGVTLHSTS